MINSFRVRNEDAMEVLRSETLKELKHLDSHLHHADEDHQSALSKKSD